MWHIIINPAAGNGKAGRFLPSIENAFAKAQLPYTILQSKRPWHCAILAKEAIEKGVSKQAAYALETDAFTKNNGDVYTNQFTFVSEMEKMVEENLIQNWH